MNEENSDEKQFFRDFGATAEQTVQEVRGFEENYYDLGSTGNADGTLGSRFQQKATELHRTELRCGL